MNANRQRTGKQGEIIAQNYVKERGYSLLATNWHCQYGEIDIVAQNQNCIVFIEVRTRQALSTDFAFASINPKKQEKLKLSAQLYVTQYFPDDVEWRIDVIAVALYKHQPPIIDHVEDALDW